MILADTNILIDFFNSPSKEIADVFLKNDIAICGVIQAELLHGAKNDAEISMIKRMFSGLQYIDITTPDWISIGLFLLRLRKCGIAVPFADAIIAYLAIKNNCSVWTEDKHFSIIKEKIPELEIYSI